VRNRRRKQKQRRIEQEKKKHREEEEERPTTVQAILRSATTINASFKANTAHSATTP
jgi:hypothetical protein